MTASENVLPVYAVLTTRFKNEFSKGVSARIELNLARPCLPGAILKCFGKASSLYVYELA